jgi:hypothetical protein
MSVQGAVISNLDGLTFNKGYMFATRQGGTTDAVAYGALQNTSLDHAWGMAELSGPESLAPLGVGVKTETLSGSFEQGVISPEQFIIAMGGSMAFDGTNTVYTKLVEQEPQPFDLHFESDSSGVPDIDLKLYNCLMPDMSLKADNRAFVLSSGKFSVYGQSVANGGKLFTMTKPGNLTNSS